MYKDTNAPVPGFDFDDYYCIYCGAYQSDPENRRIDHISWDLAVTHRRLEKASPADGKRTGLDDDIYDLLCELDMAYTRESK